MFKVFRTLTFDKELSKLSKSEQGIIKKFEEKLVENPFVGKPLSYKFLREKKFNGKRAYFLIYEDYVIVLMMAISDKKTQQETINEIKLHMKYYYEYVKETLSKIQATLFILPAFISSKLLMNCLIRS